MFKFAQKYLNGQTQTITSAAVILAAASLASRFLGLWRDRLLAGHFGAGDALDVYYAAFRIPDLVYNLLIMGALSAGFIPVFVSMWQSGERKEAWKFVNSLLNILLLGLVVLGGIFIIFAPFFVKLITPGFSGEKFQMTVMLTRIMFLSPFLLGLSSVWGGILQSAKRFFVFSLTPIFYNLGIIFGIFFFVPKMGVYGLAWGVVLGALLHMIIQIPTLLSLGYRYSPVFGWRDAGVVRLAKLMVPRTLTLAVSQLNFVAITALASGLAAGSLAIFNFSYNIWTFPLGIMAASLATAAFPTLAQNSAAKNWGEFAKTFSGTFRQILFLIIPASALLIILRAQIVRVILGTGKFGWNDTILTINSLYFLTLGLFAEALMLLLVRGFFAVEDTKTPFWLGLAGSVFRIGGAWLFSHSMGVAGLALGYAAGGVINFFLLWFFLRHKIGSLNEKEIIWSAVKIFLASLAAALAAYGILNLMNRWVDTHTLIGIFSQGLAGGVAGLIVYFLAGLLLRSQEMIVFFRGIRRRLPFGSAGQKEFIQE